MSHLLLFAKEPIENENRTDLTAAFTYRPQMR